MWAPTPYFVGHYRTEEPPPNHAQVAAFTLLQELDEVLPNGLKDHIAALCPGVRGRPKHSGLAQVVISSLGGRGSARYGRGGPALAGRVVRPKRPRSPRPD